MDEKLEMAAASQYPAHVFPVAECCHKREGFMAGAKWQREQSPWISVEEKLPTENTGVFFIVEWEDHGKGYFVGLYGNDYWESDHRLFLPSSYIGKVTDWMPIPDFKPKNN